MRKSVEDILLMQEDFADIEWDYIPIFNTGTTFEFDLNTYADYIYNFDKIYAKLGAED